MTHTEMIRRAAAMCGAQMAGLVAALSPKHMNDDLAIKCVDVMQDIITDELSPLLERNAELEKVVERLPKDATGAIRALWDRVYHPDWIEFDDDAPLVVLPREAIVNEFSSHDLVEFENDYPTERWFVGQCHYCPDTHARDGWIIAPISECYPTLELAAAALSASGEGEKTT